MTLFSLICGVSLLLPLDQTSCFLGLWTHARSYTIGSIGSQAFQLGLDLHHQLLWPPPCKWQIVELLSLNHCRSQFLRINQPINWQSISRSIYPLGSVCLENTDYHRGREHFSCFWLQDEIKSLENNRWLINKQWFVAFAMKKLLLHSILLKKGSRCLADFYLMIVVSYTKNKTTVSIITCWGRAMND